MNNKETDLINNELSKINRLTNMLYMLENDHFPYKYADVTYVGKYIEHCIYKVNQLQSQLLDSQKILQKYKQENCKHIFEYNNIDYEPGQNVCFKCKILQKI
jgi:hypothetical protein